MNGNKMRIIKILTIFAIMGVYPPIFAQRRTISYFGDFSTLSTPATGNPSLTSSHLQPNLWVNPPIVDTVTVEEADTFVFDLHEAASFYAPFAFDTAVATRSGWYRYHVREPYHNGLRTDSLFVWFLSDSVPGTPPDVPVTPGNPDDTLPKPPVPPLTSTASIVNLVVLDGYDLTRFRILNLSDFDRAEVTLFDRTGKSIYRSQDYRNDFDFAQRKPDTYYYRVSLHRGGTVSRQEGFVEVVEHK